MGAGPSFPGTNSSNISRVAPAPAPATCRIAGVVVINLDRRPDRLARFHTYFLQSDARHLPLTRQSAVDGSKLLADGTLTDQLSATAVAELRDLALTGARKHHSQLSPGAVGCYLSHVNAWRYVANQKKPWIIMEDDAQTPKNLLSEACKAWEDNRHMLEDGAMPALLHLGIRCLLQCSATSNKGYMRPAAFWGTNCYALTPDTSRHLLRHPRLFPIDVQIDSWMSLQPDIQNVAKQVVPFESEDASDIQVPTANNNVPLFRQG